MLLNVQRKHFLDVTKCPKKTFLGWAKGLSGYPKSKTIEDPNDPAKNNP